MSCVLRLQHLASGQSKSQMEISKRVLPLDLGLVPVHNVEAPRANLPQLFSWTENRISVSS